MVNSKRVKNINTGELVRLCFIFITALIAAASVTGIMGSFMSAPKFEYSQIAEHILAGEGAFYDYIGTKYYFYGSPVYTLILSALLWISGGYEFMVICFNMVIFALTPLVIYMITKKIFSSREAIIASLIVIFHGGNLIYVGKIHPQVIDVFLITMSFLVLMRINKSTHLLAAFAGGLILGLSALARGTVFPALALWGIWFIWKERLILRRAFCIVAVVALGALIVITPVIVRGYRLYGSLIPLRTDTGINMWYGNHPGASGTSYTLESEPVPVMESMPEELISNLIGKNEVEQNLILTERVAGYFSDNPVQSWGMVIKKFYYFWWFSPHTGLLYPDIWSKIYKVYYSFILGFGCIGLWVAFMKREDFMRKSIAIFLILSSSISIMHALFYVEGRHRWQIEPLMIIFSVYGIVQSVRWLHRRIYNRNFSTTPVV